MKNTNIHNDTIIESNTAGSPKLGRRIRKLRELRDFSQEFMAFELDMSISGYSRIERDEVNLTLDKLYAICKLLDVSVFEMLNTDDSEMIQKSKSKIVTTPMTQKNILKRYKIVEDFYKEQIRLLKDELKYLREVIDRMTAK